MDRGTLIACSPQREDAFPHPSYLPQLEDCLFQFLDRVIVHCCGVVVAGCVAVAVLVILLPVFLLLLPCLRFGRRGGDAPALSPLCSSPFLPSAHWATRAYPWLRL